MATSFLLFGGFQSLQAQLYLFDFGSATTPMDTVDDPLRIWNNVTAAVGNTVGGTLTANSTDGFTAPITLTINQRFNGENANGTQTSSIYPLDATRDSLFGNTGTGFNGIAAPNPTFTLSGLDPSKTYKFTFYASRVSAGGDNRTTDYFVTGSISGSTSLNAAENVNNTVIVSDIKPTATGDVVVSLLASASNTNANKFIYLGVMELQAIPEPASVVLLISGAALALSRRPRKSSSRDASVRG